MMPVNWMDKNAFLNFHVTSPSIHSRYHEKEMKSHGLVEKETELIPS